MEIFELRYFLGVAKEQNITRASETLRISPAALSKAVTRLEDELRVSLFSREGRNIRLTDHGKLFQKRAAEIVQLEEAARLELAGHEGQIQFVIAGPEILLSEMGVSVSTDLKRRFPKSTFEFRALSDAAALKQVAHGEAHLALVTSDISDALELTTKRIAEARFQVVAAAGHPLFSAAKAKKEVPIERVLEFTFASPNHPLLGQVGPKQSLDGWRDDHFPRRVEYLTSSLKLLETLVVSGKALAYLPDYYTKRLDVEPLKIGGCPYSCVQKVRMVAKRPKDRGWLNQLF